MDLERLGKPGCRPDRDPALLVDTAERLVRRPRRYLENVRPAAAAAIPARPEVQVATVIDEILERSIFGHEPHQANVAIAPKTAA